MPNILTRRTFTGRIAGAIVILSGLARVIRAYSKETDKEVSFRWRVPAAQSEIVKNNFEFTGIIETEDDTKGLPLVLIYIGVSLLPSLVDAILTLRQTLVQPGLKIDARGDEIKIAVTNSSGQPVANLKAAGTPGLTRLNWDLRPTKDVLIEYGGDDPKKFVSSCALANASP